MQLIHGDCLEKMKDIPDGSIDMMFTSPPYYNAREYSSYATYDVYLSFIRDFVRCVKPRLNNDGFLIINSSPVIVPRTSRYTESRRLAIPFDVNTICQTEGYKFIDDIIWEKPDAASSRARKFSHHRRPMAYKPYPVTEYIMVYRKTDAPLIDRGIRKHSPDIIHTSLVEGDYERTNVWRIPPCHTSQHPAVFPVSLAERVIRYYSFKTDIICDPFMGSGSTGVACVNTNRNFIGIEKDDKYFEIAKKRIEEHLTDPQKMNESLS